MVTVSTSEPIGCLVSPALLLSRNVQSHEKNSVSHSARSETPTMSLALGEDREGMERVNGYANEIQSSRIESAIVCVR